jgi:hypothetical protein
MPALTFAPPANQASGFPAHIERKFLDPKLTISHWHNGWPIFRLSKPDDEEPIFEEPPTKRVRLFIPPPPTTEPPKPSLDRTTFPFGTLTAKKEPVVIDLTDDGYESDREDRDPRCYDLPDVVPEITPDETEIDESQIDCDPGYCDTDEE